MPSSETPPEVMPVLRAYSKRILVLSFEGFGESPDTERLARGFWHDVIAELAAFPELGVIAARSSAHWMDRLEAADRPGGDLPDFVLSGTVRRSVDAIRVTAQLEDAHTRVQVWAERYDRPGHDVFAIQDEITARVANALHLRIDQHSLVLARRRALSDLAAYEAWLRGFELLQTGTLAADEEARGYFLRALEIDPQFARGHAGLSLSYFNEWSCNAWERWGETERLAYEHARRAEAIDPNDQLVQIILGRVEQYRRRFEAAQHHFHRALALAPNDAETLVQLALYFAYQGEHALAVSMVSRGFDLNPLCPQWHYPYAAVTYFVAREYERCVALAERMGSTTLVDLPVYFAAAFAYLERPEPIPACLETFDRYFGSHIAPGRPIDLEEQIEWLGHVNPFRNQNGLDHLLDGFRRARALCGISQADVSAPPVGNRGPGPAEVEGGVRERPLRPWPIANVFRKEGATWTLCYEKLAVQAPELKGFRDVAFLLERPDEEVHVLALSGRDEVESPAPGAGVLDERARAAYQVRIRELRREIAEGEDANDDGRRHRGEEELEALVLELGKATGLGGRARKLGDPAERARSAVTWRIRHAVRKLADFHPGLARHLGNSLQTGVFCCYRPERPTVWEV